MKKLVGYLIALAGLAVMVIGFGIIKLETKLLSGLNPSSITLVSIVLIIVGVAIVLTDKKATGKKGKEKQSEEEVPIYEGVGKNRKIVGYRRE